MSIVVSTSDFYIRPKLHCRIVLKLLIFHNTSHVFGKSKFIVGECILLLCILSAIFVKKKNQRNQKVINETAEIETNLSVATQPCGR